MDMDSLSRGPPFLATWAFGSPENLEGLSSKVGPDAPKPKIPHGLHRPFPPITRVVRITNPYWEIQWESLWKVDV